VECPKCNKAMETKTFNGVEVDRCSGCNGIFCSPNEIKKGAEVWNAESLLDIGYKSVGKKYDKIDDIDCPECSVKMDKISDPVQPHIWMESCPKCNKLFLDAGEYTDLKHITILDKFRTWRKGARD